MRRAIPFCPNWGRHMRVTDSRENDVGIRRRRHCNGCQTRVTTIEMPKDHYETLLRRLDLLGNGELAKQLRDMACLLDGDAVAPVPTKVGHVVMPRNGAARSDTRGGVA